MLCLAYLNTYHPFSNKATLQYLIPGSTVNFLFDHSVCRCSSDVRASAWSCSFRSTATASSCLLSLYLALLSCQPVVQFLSVLSVPLRSVKSTWFILPSSVSLPLPSYADSAAHIFSEKFQSII